MPLLSDGGGALQALRDGLIEPADMATLLALMQSFEHLGRRCWATWKDLVRLTGLDEAEVRASADRLLEAQLVACGRDLDVPRWWFWKLSPSLITDCRGTRQSDDRYRAEWRELLAAGCRPDDRVSGSRPRYLKALAREKAARAAAQVEQPDQTMVVALSSEAPTRTRRPGTTGSAVAPAA